ncbi:helix-turn-helix domain-containing protein [Oerskovia sp. NPDC057915]|uniref:helix-turn-helix domain-containing protein n=1 Tax=Oerskovia sp. NPDC057915 TaxID=3346280 RepID=UPI0036DAFE86
MTGQAVARPAVRAATGGPAAAPRQATVGALLREWRERRRVSQLALSIEADVSTRHLSCVETGRSRPSPGLVARLGEVLDVPLRERNRLMLAAGYAPAHPETPVAALESLRASLRAVLDAHDPFPAFVVDRTWTVVEANASVQVLLDGVDEDLLTEPVNVLRIGLHPRGMAPRVVDLRRWREELLGRLRRQVGWSADDDLADLYRELDGYPVAPGPAAAPGPADPEQSSLAIPFRLRYGDDELAFLGMVTTFGTPVDVTLSELTIETFLPADDRTAEVLRAAAEARREAARSVAG